MSAAIEGRTGSTRAVFVVFEGLDGSGKSTSARQTAEALGAVLLTTPSVPVRAVRDPIIASFRGCQEAAQLFYLATVYAAAAEIRALLAAGQSVVLDRYFLSTQAYAEFRGSTIAVEHLAHGLLAADVTVFLDAPLAVRRDRIARRGDASAADRETLHPEADARLRALHLARRELPIVGRFLPLDTSTLAPDRVADLVVRACIEASALARATTGRAT